MALRQLVDDIVDKGEELDSALIDVKALEAQHAILSAAGSRLLRTKRASSKYLVPVHVAVAVKVHVHAYAQVKE